MEILRSVTTSESAGGHINCFYLFRSKLKGRGRRQAFTLTELLTALVIHSIFILMLGGTFYTLISLGSRSQMVITARERGHRVIDFVENRLSRAGVGLWGTKSTGELRSLLSSLTGTASDLAFSNSEPSKNVKLPVVITYDYQDEIPEDGLKDDVIKTKGNSGKDANILIGNVLTILYGDNMEAGDGLYIGSGGGYPILTESQLTDLPSTLSRLRGFDETVLSRIHSEVFKKFTGDYFDSEYRKLVEAGKSKSEATREANKTVGKEAFEKFWYGLLNGNTIALKADADISNAQSVFNTEYITALYTKTAEEAAYKAMEKAFLAVISDDTEVTWTRVIKDLRRYVTNTADTAAFIPAVTRALRPYAPDFTPTLGSITLLSGDIYSSQRFKTGNGDKADIRSYALLRGTGSPVLIKDKETVESLNCDPVLSGDELLSLQCIRVYASKVDATLGGTAGTGNRGFFRQSLNTKKWNDKETKNGVSWNSKPYVYEDGILEIYAELDTNKINEDDPTSERKNILTLYVLSVGGKDNMSHEKPADWPGRWSNDYKYYVTYVSKGTWKLRNVNSKFNWDE